MKNKDKINQLFHQHYRKLYAVATFLLHDEEISKDIVHDVFMQLLEKDLSLHESTAENYLMTSVRHQCLNYLHRMGIRQRIECGLMADKEPAEHDSINMERRMVHLQQAIDRLQPPQCHDVIIWHYHERLTFKEIALRLQISETMVYKYLKRALQQLRNELKDE